MKPWCVLLICLSCNLLRASGDHFLRYREEFLPHLLLAGVLAILLLSLRTRRVSPVATRTTSTTSTTSTTITTANPQLRCSNGYTLYRGPGRSFCFRYSNRPIPWDSAQTACQMENADLLVLDNESLIPFIDVLRQQQIVEGLGSAWLGAKTDGNLNARYIDGSTIPSNNRLWASGEPSRPNECIELVISFDSASLFDTFCLNSRNYICQHF